MSKYRQSQGKVNFGWIAGIAALVLLAIGIVPRVLQNSELQASAAAEKGVLPIVQVDTPMVAPRTASVDVPGTIEAFEQTAVDARATGYALKVFVDIGDRVAAGQTLALITAPDSDQDVLQARAQLIQSEAALAQAQADEQSGEGNLAENEAALLHAQSALLSARATLGQLRDQLAEAMRSKGEQDASLSEAQANLDLDRVTNVRNQTLANEGYLARQTADESEAQYKVGAETVTSSEAAVAVTDATIDAAAAGVATGIDNVQAAVDDVGSAKGSVAAAQSTVASDKDAISEAVDGVDANKANLQRLVILQNYEAVTAPFAGVVTARNIDPGAYIAGGSSTEASTSIGSGSAGAAATGASAGGSSTSGSSATTTSASGTGGLFTIARLDRLRVYINLPQSDASLLTASTPARISVAMLPGRTFTGAINHSTVAFDPQSRTLIAEIIINNRSGVLRPGMFCDVLLTIPQPRGILLVPDSALMTGGSGTQLILVGPGNKLHLQDVQVGDDDGVNLQILSGLALTDRVVSSPQNGFYEGEEVQVQAPLKRVHTRV